MGVIYVLRAFGGTIILTTTPVQPAPGVATISDTAHGSAAIGDVLVDQASTGDVATGSVTIADQG